MMTIYQTSLHQQYRRPRLFKLQYVCMCLEIYIPTYIPAYHKAGLNIVPTNNNTHRQKSIHTSQPPHSSDTAPPRILL